jgi:predicted transglutaminase-like cysteine proteinase
MRLATVHVAGAPADEDHVVLLVRIAGETYVLDNLTDALWPASAVRYEWRSVQREGDPWHWLRISGAPA